MCLPIRGAAAATAAPRMAIAASRTGSGAGSDGGGGPAIATRMRDSIQHYDGRRRRGGRRTLRGTAWTFPHRDNGGLQPFVKVNALWHCALAQNQEGSPSRLSSLAQE